MKRSRLLVAGVVWALLVATTAAFVATEALKLKRPVVAELRGNRVFSPVCDCRTRVAKFSFRLRRADTIDVSIVTGGEVVRSIAADVRRSRGRARFRWNGKTDTGDFVSDGAYRVRVSLEDDGRTVTFAKRIFVDTRGPVVELVEVEPNRIEPGDSVTLRFELDEAARVILRVDGRRASRLGRFDRGSSEAIWAGTVRGDALAPGDHELSLRVRDRAGNRTRTAGTMSISAAGDST